MENRIWDAAELVLEWDAEDRGDILRYKLFAIPRSAIDDDNEEIDAHLLIGIDNGGVRRVDELFDSAYGRITNENRIFINELLLESVPDEAREILKSYVI